MKKAPYKEIIDMKAEQKEYALLCEGKSKKFKVYSEWEDHIKDLLAKFHTLKDLYNFKHYCVNASRAHEKTPDMYIVCISLFIPLYLDTFFMDLPTIIAPLVFLVLVAHIVIQNKKLTKESCFYKDIIEIAEKIECEQKETTD